MSHYYDPSPEVPSDISMTEMTLEGRHFCFATDRGVFSRGRIDTGSAALLEAVVEDLRRGDGPPLPEPLSLWDLACGYGVLGIVLKRLFPAFSLTMTDINARAVALTRRNLREHDILEATVLQADGVREMEPTSVDLASRRYSVVVLNPPIRTGKSAVHRLLETAEQALLPGGRLYTVFGKKQGASSYGRYLAARFAHHDRILLKKGFYVYRNTLDM